jgi:hypothetical protein
MKKLVQILKKTRLSLFFQKNHFLYRITIKTTLMKALADRVSWRKKLFVVMSALTLVLSLASAPKVFAREDGGDGEDRREHREDRDRRDRGEDREDREGDDNRGDRHEGRREHHNRD